MKWSLDIGTGAEQGTRRGEACRDPRVKGKIGSVRFGKSEAWSKGVEMLVFYIRITTATHGSGVDIQCRRHEALVLN